MEKFKASSMPDNTAPPMNTTAELEQAALRIEKVMPLRTARGDRELKTILVQLRLNSGSKK